jgi:hypothetical protein
VLSRLDALLQSVEASSRSVTTGIDRVCDIVHTSVDEQLQKAMSSAAAAAVEARTLLDAAVSRADGAVATVAELRASLETATQRRTAAEDRAAAVTVELEAAKKHAGTVLYSSYDGALWWYLSSRRRVSRCLVRHRALS